MNDKKMMRGMSILMVLLALVMVASGVQAQEAADNESTEAAYKMIGAGLALGLAGIGTGLSQGPIGAAAVGMIAEDGSKFGTGLLFTVLPETVVLFGFLAMFLL